MVKVNRAVLLSIFLILSCIVVEAKALLIPWTPNFATLPKYSRVEYISAAPYIVIIHDFINDAEAEHLKTAAKPLLKASTVVEEKNNTTHAKRSSSSAFLQQIDSEFINSIRERAARLVNTPVRNVEPLQVTHYCNGQKYDPHFDYFDRSLASAKAVIGQQGQRIATVLIYLNDINEHNGGETIFLQVQQGLKITPKKNMAVFWFNVLPNGKEDERTLHGSLPIHSGEKWVANIWIRDPRLVY